MAQVGNIKEKYEPFIEMYNEGLPWDVITKTLGTSNTYASVLLQAAVLKNRVTLRKPSLSKKMQNEHYPEFIQRYQAGMSKEDIMSVMELTEHQYARWRTLAWIVGDLELRNQARIEVPKRNKILPLVILAILISSALFAIVNFIL